MISTHFILLASFLLCSAIRTTGLTTHTPNKILGEEYFPIMASIQQNGKHICGGVIIDRSNIITSAGCILKSTPMDNLLENLSVVVGTKNLTENNGTRFYVQGFAYDFNCKINQSITDIGILYIEGKIKYNKYIKPIPIETDEIDLLIPGFAIGWETVEMGNKTCIHVSKMDVMTTYRRCSRIPEFVFDVDENIGVEKILNSPSCIAELGSALIIDNKLAGILSRKVEKCSMGYCNVYQRLPDLDKWLAKKAHFVY